MICPRGHGFDEDREGRCPVCGLPLPRIERGPKSFRVTRKEMVRIREALRAGMLVARAAKKLWPQVAAAEDIIQAGVATADTIKARTGYGPRHKAEPKKCN